MLGRQLLKPIIKGEVAPPDYSANEVFFLDFENTNSLNEVHGGVATVLPAGGTISNILSPAYAKYGSYGGNFADHYLKFLQTAILSIGTGDFTFQCWMYPPSTQPAQVNGYIPLFGGTNYTNVACFWLNTNVILWYVSGGACQTTSKVNINAWNHIRVVRNAGKMYIFLNGVLGSPAGGVASPLTNLTTSWAAGFFIGAEPSQNRFFRGGIDSLQVFNISLGISNFTPKEKN